MNLNGEKRGGGGGKREKQININFNIEKITRVLDSCKVTVTVIITGPIKYTQ